MHRQRRIPALFEEGYLQNNIRGVFILNPALRKSGGWFGGVTGTIRRAAVGEMTGLLFFFNESVVFGEPGC